MKIRNALLSKAGNPLWVGISTHTCSAAKSTFQVHSEDKGSALIGSVRALLKRSLGQSFDDLWLVL